MPKIYPHPLHVFLSWKQDCAPSLRQKAQTPISTTQSPNKQSCICCFDTCEERVSASHRAYILPRKKSVLQESVIAASRHWVPRTRTRVTHSFPVHSVTVSLRFYTHTVAYTRLFLSHVKEDWKYVNQSWPTTRTHASSSSPLHCPHGPKCLPELQP